MQTTNDDSRTDGDGDGGPITLLAIVTGLALVGSVAWAFVFGL
jgi:hypothetical protein